MNDRIRPLGWPAYGVAFLLIALPLLDSVLGIWPPRTGEVSWRYGAVGLLSRAVMTPLLGMLGAIVVAALMEHRVMLRVLSALSFVGAALCLTAIALFGLDALQTRAGVAPQAVGAFDIATVVAMVKYTLGAAIATALGIGGWKASRPPSARGRTGGGASRSEGILMPAGRRQGQRDDS